MQRKFELDLEVEEQDFCDELEITVTFECFDGEECEITEIEVYNNSKMCFISRNSLSKEMNKKIDDYAKELSEVNRHEAYLDYLDSKGDV